MAQATQSVSYENYMADFTIREKVLDFLEDEDVFLKEDYDEYRDRLPYVQQ